MLRHRSIREQIRSRRRGIGRPEERQLTVVDDATLEPPTIELRRAVPRRSYPGTIHATRSALLSVHGQDRNRRRFSASRLRSSCLIGGQILEMLPPLQTQLDSSSKLLQRAHTRGALPRALASDIDDGRISHAGIGDLGSCISALSRVRRVCNNPISTRALRQIQRLVGLANGEIWIRVGSWVMANSN